MNESEFLKRRNKANGIIGAVKETSSNSRRTTPPKSSSPTTTKMSESQFIKRRNMARYRKLGVSEKMGGIMYGAEQVKMVRIAVVLFKVCLSRTVLIFQGQPLRR